MDATAYESYLDYYRREICPRLCELDVMAHSGEPLNRRLVAKALGITEAEALSIIERNGLRLACRGSIRVLLFNGSGRLCRLFRRELECGSPLVYSREHISYIHGLNQIKLNAVCDELRIIEAGPSVLPLIFSRLPFEALMPGA